MAPRLTRAASGGWVVVLSLCLLPFTQVETSVAAGPELGLVPAFASSLGPAPGALTADLRHMLDRVGSRDMLDVLVTLRAQADPLRTPDVGGARNRRSVIRTLRSTARSAQANLLRALSRWQVRGDVRRIRPLWIVDAVAVRVRARLVDAIAETPGVAHVELDRSSAVPTSVPTGAPEAGVVTIGAPTLWDLGLTGADVVVANMDTGVDVDHPDLSASWRGGTNSWFDPSGQHPSIPTDLSGHGTETMGIMVGRDAGGSTIGVAPDATWIAAKIFNDGGSANTSGIHAAFQWMLDPDGDVLTDDAPDVVEGSWSMGSPGCDLTYEPDLQALRAVGILPVFAAGNGGPSADTSMSPGNNPSAFAVGAVDDADVISSISSRGPSTCGGSTEVFPDVVAPGEDVHTSDLFGTYVDASGTSMSAPHVAGGLALLLQAFPDSSPVDQGSALTVTGLDLGVAGLDDTYGNGRVDLPAAYAWLESNTEPPSPPPLLSIRSDRARTIGQLAGVRDEDVVSFDGASFATVLDGSDVGLSAVDIDAVSRVDASAFLLSFDKPVLLPGVGVVDDSDVVRFVATSQGADTAGSFSMELRGADVGLSTDVEDIDAIDVLPSGELLVSIRGKGAVPGVTSFVDEDVLRFGAYGVGSGIAGSFSMYFDGSDIGLELDRLRRC